MKGKNTKAVRMFPDDIDWMKKQAAYREYKGIDKQRMKPARTIRAMRNIIEGDAALLRKLTGAPLKP